ncbi:MAG: SWIB/MDM2 domain-containing protein, partial [Caulobacteraceae bacterium]
LADAKLRPVFGGKDKVSMFEMNKHIAKHLS